MTTQAWDFEGDIIMKMDHLKFLSKIGAKGGAASRLKNSCRSRIPPLDHDFEDGVCTRCGASERKTLASQKNAQKGGRPRDKQPSKAALAKRRSRARLQPTK